FRRDEEDESVCDVFEDTDAREACRTRTPVPADPLSGSFARFRQERSETGNNTVLGYSGRLTWNLRGRVTLEAWAARNESAAQTGAGFRSRTFGVAARIGF